MGRVYAVASAKGGVGKTTTTANLGVALAAAGHTVAVVDADVAMPNLGRMLGLSPDGPSLHNVLAEETDPLDAVYDGPEGLAVVPGTTTLEDYVKANPRKLGTVLDALGDDYDIILIDTGAGLSHETLLPLGLADRVILVSTPSPDALGDTAKTAALAERIGATVAGIVLTRVDSDRVDVDALVDSLDFPLMGLIPEDPSVEDTSADAESVMTAESDSPAAAAYRALADAVIADTMQESFEAPVTDDSGDAGEADDVDGVDDADNGDDADDSADAEDADADPDVDTDPVSEIDISSVLDSDSDTDTDSDLDEILSLDAESGDEAPEDGSETVVDASPEDGSETEPNEEPAPTADPDETEDSADSQTSGGIASALADAEVATDSNSDSEAADADEPLVTDAVAEAEPEAEAEAAPEEDTADVTIQHTEIPDAEDAADSDSDADSKSASGADDDDDDDEKSGKKGLFGRFFG